MPTAIRPNRARALLLALAVMLHALAGMGLMRAHAANSSASYTTGICMAAGFAKFTQQHSHPDGQSSHYDCCKLCAASGPILLADTSFAVSPAPTFIAPAFIPASGRMASLAVIAHPPRGPPALT